MFVHVILPASCFLLGYLMRHYIGKADKDE